jgi:hypothetical protein
MNITKFFKFNTSSEELNRVQDNLVRTLAPIFTNPILNYTLLSEVQLVVGTNTINHKLGRPLIGWIVTRKRSAAEIYDTQDSNLSPQNSLLLMSDAIVTVDLYCF